MRGLRAKRMRTVKEGTLIATVDIGAATNTGYCTSMDGRDIKVFRFANTKEGFEKFWHMIVSSKNRFECSEVAVGFESTGPYAEPLVHYLKAKPVRIVQVNPMHTKRLKEVNDNSPGKTDDKDPRVIADVLRLGHALSVIVPEGDAQRISGGSATQGNGMSGNARLCSTRCSNWSSSSSQNSIPWSNR
jgi:transposase